MATEEQRATWKKNARLYDRVRRLCKQTGLPVPPELVKHPRGRRKAATSDAERSGAMDPFLERVRPDPKTGCINWKLRPNKHGYGYFWNGKELVAAHREAYRRAYGAIPPGLLVRHLCHNRRCVNPEHLAAGTQQDNMDDMTDALRGGAKLTSGDVATIVGLLLLGRRVADVAGEYGVSPSMVFAIRNGSRRSDAINRELDRERSGAPRPTVGD